MKIPCHRSSALGVCSLVVASFLALVCECGFPKVATTDDGRSDPQGGLLQKNGKPAAVEGLPQLVQQLGHSQPVNCAVLSSDGKLVFTASRDRTGKLWDVETGNEVRQFMGHSDEITSAAFSPNGKWVVTGSRDRTVRLWDAASGRELRQFRGHDGSIISVSFSADGRKIVTGGDGTDSTARLWDPLTGEETSCLRHSEEAAAVAFSADGGRVFTADANGDLSYWEKTHAPKGTMSWGAGPFFKGHIPRVAAVAVAPDGKYLLAGTLDGTISVWEIAGGKEVCVLSAENARAPVRTVAMSRGGKQILTADNVGEVRLWDFQTKRVLWRIKAHADAVQGAAFSADGATAITAGKDGTARIWKTPTGKEQQRFRHDQEVLAAVLSDDGKHAVTASKDRSARLWDADSGRELRRFEHTAAVQAVALSADGRQILTATEDGMTWLWDAASGKRLRQYRSPASGALAVTFLKNQSGVRLADKAGLVRTWSSLTDELIAEGRAEQNAVRTVAVSADGMHVLSIGADGAARLWDVAARRELRCFKATAPVISAALSDDGKRLLTGGFDGSGILWDVPSGKELSRLQKNGGPVNHVAFTSDGSKVVTGSRDGISRLFDLATSQELPFSCKRSPEGINAVAYSPDGTRFLVADRNGRCSWKTADKKKDTFGAYFRHSAEVLAVAVSPDGKQVVTGCADGETALWDARTYRLLLKIQGHAPYSVCAVAFSPDGKQILTGGKDRTARLWSALTGSEVTRFNGHASFVNGVAFSADGGRVVTGSEDGSVRYWDPASGREVQQLKLDSGPVTSVAFSPNGNAVLVGCGDGSARFWDLAADKNEGRTLKGHTDVVSAVKFSPDGTQALTSSRDATIRLWDVSTGTEVRQFVGHAGPVTSIAFDAKGRHIVSGSWDMTGRIWETSTGKELRQARQIQEYSPRSFSRDGRLLLTSGPRGTTVLWDGDTGQALCRFDGTSSSVNSVCFSPDSRWLLTSHGDGIARLWDVSTWQLRWELRGHKDILTGAAISTDSKWVVTGSRDRTARLWDVASGREIRRFDHPSAVWSVALAPDGKYLLTGSPDDLTRLWDVASGKLLRQTEGSWDPNSCGAFSPDGSQLITLGPRWLQLQERDTGKVVRQFGDGYGHDALSVAYSPSGKQLATGGHSSTAQLWDVTAGRMLLELRGHSEIIMSVSFSPDGKHILTGSKDGTARLWNSANGREISRLEGHTGSIMSAGFSPDGRWIVTGGGDGTIRLWDAAAATELARLMTRPDGTWFVANREGRFDSNDLDAIRGVCWVIPDDPFRPLRPEIFMRDYYEPRLLARILAGETFAPVPSLVSLNRVQPRVEIARIEPQSSAPDEVIVTVTVTGQSRTLGEGKGRKTYHSGAHDLQVFRDGQLVASFPDPEGSVTLEKTGSKTVRFEHIRLPRLAGKKEVEFSAYAFNSDRVKSATATAKYALPVDVAPRPRTAYVIAVGVNAFEKARDLSFAVPDAKLMAATMPALLLENKQFERAVVVPLLADARMEKGQRILTERSATRSNVQSVLRILAGGKADAELLKQVPAARDLAAARPEDLVLISFSTHGYNGSDGKFHLLPADDGKHTISTDDLSLWLRHVDAGEMVLVVDACHSAGAVEEKGFKPGPMGSRGLGQLAYSKRMRILAASQASSVALEHERIGHGLLTYALVHNGLKEGQADFAPADKRITLKEWLQFGVKHVPELAAAIAAGKMRADLQATEAERALIRQGRRTVAQQPSLFDFSKGGDGLLLRELAGAKE